MSIGKMVFAQLRIKAFYGTTENRVKTQIWMAIGVSVLVALIKERVKLHRSLYTILQILSVTLFKKIRILQALSDIDNEENMETHPNQLNLFNSCLDSRLILQLLIQQIQG